MSTRASSAARRLACLVFVLWTLLVALSFPPVYADDDGSSPGGSSSGEDGGSSSATASSQRTSSSNENDEEADWGSFYDPNNVFCGQHDCYKILGFDFLNWGSDPPSLKDITKSYRSLSRRWHPDKNKAKGAREKFVAIAKAYEILTDFEKRSEYDHFRDRPDEYFKKYGSSVLWSYAPKSDASIIIILFLIAGSAFTYYAQKNKWQTIANHLVRAATEDLSPREGGSTESMDIRDRALVILAERKKEAEANGSTKDDNGEKKKKEKGQRLTQKEKREKEWDELRPICIELVNEVDDFGAGFRKPTWRDLLVVRMVKWPYYMSTSIFWWSKYALRRLRKIELNEEERLALTKNAVGQVTWVAATEEEREEMLTLELWITDNLAEWREEQEMKLAGLSANRRKQIKKWRKKGGEPIEEDFKMD